MENEQHGRQPDRDDVATLVRIAGRRRAVPADRAQRVKAAARAQWRDEVVGRSRRRFAWSVAALVAAASLVLAITFGLLPSGTSVVPQPSNAARVQALTGTVRTTGEPQGDPEALAVDDRIEVGSALETADAGRIAIALASGHSIRIDASSRVRLVGRASVRLERGALYVDSGVEGTSTGSIEVLTPFGTVRDVGTQFEVRLDEDALRVRLREGAAVLSHQGRTHEIATGVELLTGSHGEVQLSSIEAYGDIWEWVTEVTPMPQLEGRSALEFLEWVARERGWTLVFADASLAGSAAEIVLGGSVERLTVRDALDAVLPTCGLAYRVEGGRLLVESETGSSR